MKPSEWRWIKGLRSLLAMPRPEVVRQAERIVSVQRHIVLPIKAGLIAVVLYYLLRPGQTWSAQTWRVHHEIQSFIVIYILCNAAVAPIFLFWRKFPPGLFQWVVFGIGLLDGVFVSGLVLITEGFASMAYWLFPALIVLNAVSIPLATPQIVLNLLLSVFYLSAGFLYLNPDVRKQLVPVYEPSHPRSTTQTNASDPLPSEPSLTDADGTNSATTGTNHTRLSRYLQIPIDRFDDASWNSPGDSDTPPLASVPLLVSVLWLLTACCYGVQLLAERQRRTTEEEREFAAREAQLRTAGRLAAEIAHQLKNPLAIINNTVFSLQRASKDGRPASSAHIQMIQEEISHADTILTDLMGYAQLAEGRMEKLSVTEELDRALLEVFPPAADFQVEVQRRYAPYFPPLMMQRRHLSGILVNLLQNAREALNGVGRISVTADCHADSSIEVVISDNGPGIPPDKLGKIFEPYFTTKEKGTGLGLAVVKHNVELYSGTVRVESELGKGARFVLLFPAKSVINLSRKSKTT